VPRGKTFSNALRARGAQRAGPVAAVANRSRVMPGGPAPTC